MSSSADGGHLFIVSAPSGAGKTTLIHNMMSGGEPIDRIGFSVSYTTREPRAGEEDGRDYHFVTGAVFREMIDDSRFLEWAQVHDHYYGTATDEVLPRLAEGMDVVLDIDVQGAERILSLSPEVLPLDRRHGIFVLPPGYAELRHRLEQRNLDKPEDIRRRLRVALGEVQHYQQYEYVIVNEDASRASEVLAAIILEKRHREPRMRDRVAEALKDFPPVRDS